MEVVFLACSYTAVATKNGFITINFLHCNTEGQILISDVYHHYDGRATKSALLIQVLSPPQGPSVIWACSLGFCEGAQEECNVVLFMLS